jgi:peptide subunit release factor 1 (eRF1)
MTLSPMALQDVMVRLANFQPGTMPVLSLYLNTQPDQHGRANYDSYLRKELKSNANLFEARSPERDSFDRDAARIEDWLRNSLRPSSNGVAIFACSAADDFFEALQFDAAIPENQLYVYNQPHIFALARLQDQYPRYAVLLADTNAGRVFTFGLGRTLHEDGISNTKMRDMTEVGRWSRAKEDSRADNYRMQHAAELIEQLNATVQSENIEHIVLAGDDVVLPTLRDQLSPYLAERVIGTLALDIKTPEHDIRAASYAALREHDTKQDLERAEAVLNAYRSGGLAAGGAHDVLSALANGQVQELFVSGNTDEQHSGVEDFGMLSALLGGADNVDGLKVADALVSGAVKTSARITFIEDALLLSDMGGIAASLRFRL